MLIKKDGEKMTIEEDFVDIYSFSVELSSLYRMPILFLYEKLKEIYPNEEIPKSEAFEIKRQVEEQVRNYEIKEEEVEVALALVKLGNFSKEERNEQIIYTTEIIYHREKENYFLRYEEFKMQNENWYRNELGFHYSPYKFDSNPEKDFFVQVLLMLNENPADVEDIYYTGAINDINKTDFIFEYKGKDGRWHNYTPDFLIKKKDGKMIIVEVKGEPYRIYEEEKLMKEIEGINPEKVKYEILITEKDEIGFTNINKIKEDIYGYGGENGGKTD